MNGNPIHDMLPSLLYMYDIIIYLITSFIIRFLFNLVYNKSDEDLLVMGLCTGTQWPVLEDCSGIFNVLEESLDEKTRDLPLPSEEGMLTDATPSLCITRLGVYSSTVPTLFEAQLCSMLYLKM